MVCFHLAVDGDEHHQSCFYCYHCHLHDDEDDGTAEADIVGQTLVLEESSTSSSK